MNWHQRTLIALGLAVAASNKAGAQSRPATATLTGIIRDSAGTPLPSVEVLLTETTRTVRSDNAGRFSLGGVSPSAYRVWFRRLGYASTQFDWTAQVGQTTELAIVMTPIARTLDPVVVMENEEKAMKDRASILGLVIDSAGTPIEEAEVQLVGSNRSGLTRGNGGFLFRPLLIGPYVIRVRKLGYEPNVVKLALVAGDDREVIIRMKRISTELDPIVVTARSGYDPLDQQVWDDLEKRMRWKSLRNPILGPEDLKRYRGADLDVVIKTIMLGRSDAATTSKAPTSKRQPQKSVFDQHMPDACILLNGKTAVKRPLHVFDTDQIDLLEVYPAGSEFTGTVGWYMDHVPGCQSSGLFTHPPYYVLWLKGGK
jgi:hypothetical protein